MEKGKLCIKPSFQPKKTYSMCKCYHNGGAIPRCREIRKEFKHFSYPLTFRGIKLGLTDFLDSEIEYKRTFDLNISPSLEKSISSFYIKKINQCIKSYNKQVLN